MLNAQAGQARAKNGTQCERVNWMTVNNRSDEVPTEQAPKDGPLTHLVEERDRSVPDDVRTEQDSSAHEPAPKEYAEGTAEHDDDSEA